MLNEKSLSLILQQNITRPLKIESLDWRTQDATPASLLFYRINPGEKAEQQFLERITQSKFAWLIVNKKVSGLPSHASVVEEKNWPRIQKELCDQLYPLPHLKLIAITGTNGKTTTTDLVLQLGEMMGKKGLSVGTLGLRENKKTILDFGLTSPPYLDLRKYLFQYGQNKDFCVMEASSHALIQDRLYALEFDGAGWLSFSQDHLDYHHNMEAYFDAKSLLLKQLKPSAKMFIPDAQETLFTKVSLKSKQVFKAPPLDVELPLFFRTRFNRDNLEVAVAILEDVFKMPHQGDFEKILPPDGRFYIRNYGSNFIVVDFAHTPDALDNICHGLKEAFPQHKLKVLFGCGGDRDRTKRPQMGEVVEKWADHIYVTSDNPRSEDPAQIIQDIAQGIKHKKFDQIIDRKQAVARAFAELEEEEILLLAGKGHEDYILINGVKYPYSDIQEVDTFLSRKNV